MANLFVDEARLSGNTFRFANDEYQALIENYDSSIVEDINSDGGVLVQGELYLF